MKGCRFYCINRRLWAVVFSDIDMPGAVDGFELAKWIREHRPGLDVLLAGTVPPAPPKARKTFASEGPCQNLTRRRSSTITFVVRSLVATLPENYNADVR